MPPRARTPLLAIFLPLAAMLLAGCKPEKDIARYRVPKQAEVERLNPARPRPAASATAGRGAKARTLAAIVPNGQQGWFFKLTGDPAALAGVQPAFESFVRSLKFEANEPPEWTLPEGWSAQPGNEFRYATLLVEGPQPPLEVTVTTLPGPEEGGLPTYLLDNVNRWRGQLQLPPLEADELAEETETVELTGASATLVDISGVSSGAGMGQPPFAGGGPGAGQALAPAPNAGGEGVSVTAPEGWTPGATNEVRKAVYTVRDGDALVEVTVIDLPRAAVSLLQQLNRWRGQVELAETTQAELDKQVRQIPVGRDSAQYVEALGGELAVLAAVVQRGDTEWFFKIMGDRRLAERERERFQQFVRSAAFGGQPRENEEATDGQ